MNSFRPSMYCLTSTMMGEREREREFYVEMNSPAEKALFMETFEVLTGMYMQNLLRKKEGNFSVKPRFSLTKH